MLYITGDTHGDYWDLFERTKDLGLTSDDTVIICGDFGFIFIDDYFLTKLTLLPWNIAFVDGNHENFDKLESYPVEEWNGGTVHRIAKNIVHLMRGNVFTIEEKTFFCMGGAYSIDKGMRKEGVSWWSRESPSNEEYRTASASLEKHNMTVDYILTHNIPERGFYELGYSPDMHDKELVGFLQWVFENVNFKEWFAGHFHIDKVVCDRVRILYGDVVPVSED
jgi:predicted phosphodiesterase